MLTPNVFFSSSYFLFYKFGFFYSHVSCSVRGVLAQSRKALAVACNPIQGLWFILAEAKQPFHPLWVGEIVPKLF